MRNAPKSSGRSWQPQVSPGLVRVFAAYSRRYLGRNFHTLRILKSGLPPHDPTRPLVIYLNHAAWWDPLVCLLLSREFFPRRTSYAAMDAAMLKRYGFFKWLGFFGVERNEPGAGRGFLRITRALLASAQNAVWLTPQGRFVDVRERPLRLQNGVGALAARHLETTFVPLAIEYTFWTEQRPEILVSFGEPIVPRACPARTRSAWALEFADALETTQDELAARSCLRHEADWMTLNRGVTIAGGLRGAWRWLWAHAFGGRSAARRHPEASS